MGKKLTHEKFLERLLKTNEHYANGEFIVIGEYRGNDKPVECHCNIHNIEWFPIPINLWRKTGCPYCGGVLALEGFNDMWTTRPDIALMLQDPEDGYKYTSYSKKKTWFICPDCKSPNFKEINHVSRVGICCQHCSDGISYPNKFSRALLDQLPIDKYDCEYQPEWAKPYFYDNHFWYNGIEYILEMDGYLHYMERDFHRYTLKYIQEKDRIKNELAAQHGIHVIRIDCIKSEMDYIKKNILISELSDIFDLSKVDWELCDKKSQKNISREACELYVSNIYSIKEICEILHVSQSTIHRYLSKGSKYGWCDYGSKRKNAANNN